jgi:hypothetical protein
MLMMRRNGQKINQLLIQMYNRHLAGRKEILLPEVVLSVRRMLDGVSFLCFLVSIFD